MSEFPPQIQQCADIKNFTVQGNMAAKADQKPRASNSTGFDGLVSLLASAAGGDRLALEGRVLKALEEAFDASRGRLVSDLRMYKAMWPGRLHKESVRLFMRKNELVSEHAGLFLAWIADLLPVGFVEILFEGPDACRHYRKVLAKVYASWCSTSARLDVEEHDPGALRGITPARISELVVYPGVAAYMSRHLMCMGEDERLFLISRHLKRGDFEYYLHTLIDDSQDSRYKACLEEYLCNRVYEGRPQGYSVFMNVYNFAKRSGRERCEDEAVVQRVFEGYDVKELLKSDIGAMFVARTVGCAAQYAGSVERCRRIVEEALEADIPRRASRALWDILSASRGVLVGWIDRFKVFEDEDLGRILLHGRGMRRGEGPSICRAMDYGDGMYRGEAVSYVVGMFSAREIVDVLGRQDSDERDFLLECVYRKALAGEFDLRVLEAEDDVWVDRIFDEMFKTQDDGIYKALCEKRPELVFDYCFRHRGLRRRYFERIDKERCTVEDGICIYRILKHEFEEMGCLGDAESYAAAVYGDCGSGNDVYVMSTAVDPEPCGGIVEFMYLMTLIRPDDAKYYVCEHFGEICEEGRSAGERREDIGGGADHPSVLGISDLSLIRAVPRLQMVETILSVHLKDKYLAYTVMGLVLDSISAGPQAFRLVVLRSMDSSIVTAHHVVGFIDTLAPLLHDSNAHVCSESRRLLMNISIATPELACLQSQMVQSVVDRMYAKSFFDAVCRVQFNHYLCFNGLNMLVQVLTMHMRDLKESVFPILGSLSAIAQAEDLRLVFPVVFESLSAFVVENAFYVDECCRVAGPLMRFGSDVSFDKLIGSMGRALRVSRFLVSCLKMCDAGVVERVVERVVRSGGEGGVEPFFLAYAPELPVFEKYVPVFLPLLKRLFLSSDAVKQDIAARAFESMDVVEFLMVCCITGEWKTRLLCVELLERRGVEDDGVLAMLFILRNDMHSALRKKVLDIWKSMVANTNSVLRRIHGVVLGCLGYKESAGSFHDAVMGALSDLVVKYDGYVERYVTEIMGRMGPEGHGDAANPLRLDSGAEGLEICSEGDVVEAILMESARHGKHLDLALDFGARSSSARLLRMLLEAPSHRERAVEAIGRMIDDPAVSRLFVGNSRLGIDLFMMTRKTFLFEFLSSSDRMSLLELILGEQRQSKECIKELLRHMEPSERLEQLLLGSDPVYTSAFYGARAETGDLGHARELFIRAFNSLDHKDLSPLIAPGHLDMLLDVSYKNVKDPEALVGILCSSGSPRAFSRLEQVVSSMDVGDSLFVLCGHLLRSYLFYERRECVLPCLGLVHGRYRGRLGAFDLIVGRLLDEGCL